MSIGDRRYAFHVCPGRKQFYRYNQMASWESENILYVHEPVQAARDAPESLRWDDLLTDCVGFGAKIFVVAINKMDSLEWSEQLYLAEVERVRSHLKGLGVEPQDMSFVPISGARGQNLLEKSLLMPWFDGKILAEALKCFQLPFSPLAMGLRMVINQRFKVSGVGSCLIGRVASDSLVPGMDAVLITPDRHILVQIKSVEAGLSPKPDGARCGEIASANIKGISLRDIPRGSIMIPFSNYPIQLFTRKFIAKLKWIGKKERLVIGYEPTILYHVSNSSCRFTNIRWPDMDEDEWIEVEMEARNPIYVETVHDCQPLSTFILKDNSRTIGFGHVIKRLQVEQ